MSVRAGRRHALAGLIRFGIVFSEEVTVNWNIVVRQTHRWVSMVFTLTVIMNFVALGLGHGEQPPPWVTYSPLLPLFVLLLSGLYLFVLPYVSKRRA